MSEIAVCHSELVKCLGREIQNCRLLKYAVQNATFYQRASSRFDLPAPLFAERGYMLVEDLIKLEKLSGFWAHNNLLQVWHRNTHFQKQMQAKDSSSGFNWVFQSDYLREKAACTYEAEGEGLQRSGWQRWFLLWQKERKTVNSSVVKHKGVLKENRKFPTDTTFTKLVPGFCSLPNCRDRDQGWHQDCHRSGAASSWENWVELCRGRVRLRHCGNPERAGGLKEKHWSSQNAFLECCHHPLAGWQNSTGSSAEHGRRSRTGNRSLFL